MAVCDVVQCSAVQSHDTTTALWWRVIYKFNVQLDMKSCPKIFFFFFLLEEENNKSSIAIDGISFPSSSFLYSPAAAKFIKFFFSSFLG